MNANSRACVACIAAAIASGSTPRSVYDYSQQKHISISGSATTSSVNIYDYDRGCYYLEIPIPSTIMVLDPIFR